jgi:hypothetical protein
MNNTYRAPVGTPAEWEAARLLDLFERRRQLLRYRAFSSLAWTAGPTTPASAAR